MLGEVHVGNMAHSDDDEMVERSRISQRTVGECERMIVS